MMSSANASEGWELVVGPDGSIAAEQLSRLGVSPGAHLRVVAEPAQGVDKVGQSLAGRLRERFDDDAVDRFDAWQQIVRSGSSTSNRREGCR